MVLLEDCWALCPPVLDLVDPEWGPGMCVSHKFWEPHVENHCFWGYLAIPWLPGNVAVHLDQLQFLFSLWQIRILQKLWAVFPKLRLPKMTLLGLPSYPWQSPSIQRAFPTHHLSHYFLMLGWDVLTFVFHLTFLNVTHWSRWEGWFRCHHDEHWFWEMYPSLCPPPCVSP